jgi:UDPglucose--hexose-1-phosphate uridylyltransferase
MELRKDYLLDRYVIVAADRAKRPSDFIKEKDEERNNNICPFCPGNEHMTPEETGRFHENNTWKMRWFTNKFPAVELHSGDGIVRTDNSFFSYSDAHGVHEIIVDTPVHDQQMWDLDSRHLSDLLGVYSYRAEELYRIPQIKYVSVFKNHGREAGTSIYHSHSQVIGFNAVPSLVRELLDASKRYDGCPFCRIIEAEMNSERKISESDNFFALAPYASLYPFEAWIFPKRHAMALCNLKDSFFELAHMLKGLLGSLKQLNCSYNIIFVNSPLDADLHFHIRIIPRLSKQGGFELLGSYINAVSPEQAAAFYRGEQA